MAWAGIGLWTSGQVEDAMGMKASKEQEEELERSMAVRVQRVEREGR